MTIDKINERIAAAKCELARATLAKYENRASEQNKPQTVAKPSEGIAGHGIHANGDVHPIDCTSYANDSYAVGNWLPTREAAELEAKRRRLTVKLKEKIAEFNDGWVPDWSDAEQIKHSLAWNTRDSSVRARSWATIQPCDPSLVFKTGTTYNFGFTNSELKLIITGEE